MHTSKKLSQGGLFRMLWELMSALQGGRGARPAKVLQRRWKLIWVRKHEHVISRWEPVKRERGERENHFKQKEMNSACRNRAGNMCRVPPRNRKRCFGEWVGEDKETAGIVKAVYTIRAPSSSSGSHDVKDYWTGLWHDNIRHVPKSKNGLLQVGPRHNRRSRDPGSQKGHGWKCSLSKELIHVRLRDGSPTSLLCLFPCSSHSLDTTPQLAQALWAITDILQWCSWLALTLQFLS